MSEFKDWQENTTTAGQGCPGRAIPTEGPVFEQAKQSLRSTLVLSELYVRRQSLEAKIIKTQGQLQAVDAFISMLVD